MRKPHVLEGICSKLAGAAGETLVETLASVLVGSLALLMLATAIGISVRIVLSSKDSMEDFYEDQSTMILEIPSGTSEDSSLALEVALTQEMKDGKLRPSTTEDVRLYRPKAHDDGTPAADVIVYERSAP